jgi:hypothetical protein
MRDMRYLRTQPVKAEAARYEVVSGLDPILGIIEEDRLAEQAWDEDLKDKDAVSLNELVLTSDPAYLRWQRARDRLKATIPTTIAGTRALASYAAEVARTSVFDEDDSHAVLANIAAALASR